MKREDFFTIEKDQDGICTIWLENKIDGINIVSPDLISIMDEMFQEMFDDSSMKAIILISKLKDFMAGADIKSFEIKKEGDFRPFQKRGHEILELMAKDKRPVIAAIDGTCYGLGLEVALACHARIVSNSPRSKMALPEVKLGILPGGGGTQRLPRLIGLQKALDMMLTGKNIFPYQAKKMGLVDEVVDKNKLYHAAKIMAKKLIKNPLERKRKIALKDKILDGTSFGRNIVFKQAKKMAFKQTQGNYPAVPAIIDCVETGLQKGEKAGYEKELEHFEKLMLTPASAGLRSLFNIMTENKKHDKPEKELKTLGMIGAGFMGSGITEVSVKNNINVYLKDIAPQGIENTKKAIWKGLKKKIKYKTLGKVEAEEIIGRVQGRLNYSDFDNADIVIEAVLEKMELKKIIIDDIQKHCKEDVIIATNTSALSVTEMAEHAKKPENVIGMHYFSPVPKMPLLEIVKTPHTAQWVIDACYDFGVRQGKTVIIANDCPGFYVNRILIPYLNECLLMVDEGIAIEDINKAMEQKGFPVGPFKLLDEVGLDVAAHVVQTGKKAAEMRPDFPVNLSVLDMFEKGYLGKKNKKGFFSYNQKGKRTGVNKDVYSFFKGDGSKKLDTKEIQDRALNMMLNEALMCLEEGIIDSPTTGDTGAVFGIGFLPFTGGPFRYMDLIGLDNLETRMKELENKYGSRFKAADILGKMNGGNEVFY